MFCKSLFGGGGCLSFLVGWFGVGAGFRGLVVGGVFEESVEVAGDVSFEAASGFSGGFSLAGSFGYVGPGFGTVAGTDDGDGVECLVELAVAASVESVAGVLSGGGFEWCYAG